MKKHEVNGIRRMRTITQLMFESVIQFSLQLYILHQVRDRDDASSINVDVTSIIISICLTIAHAILEYLLLCYEALACKTSLMNYCVACFNGKLGWVPFVDKMTRIARSCACCHDEEYDLCIDYDNIIYQNAYLTANV